jgi:hypothetical protein
VALPCTGIEYESALPVSVSVFREKPVGEAAKTSTDVLAGPVIVPEIATVLLPPETVMFFVLFVGVSENGCGTELYVTVEEALAREPGSIPIMNSPGASEVKVTTPEEFVEAEFPPVAGEKRKTRTL